MSGDGEEVAGAALERLGGLHRIGVDSELTQLGGGLLEFVGYVEEELLLHGLARRKDRALRHFESARRHASSSLAPNEDSSQSPSAKYPWIRHMFMPCPRIMCTTIIRLLPT